MTTSLSLSSLFVSIGKWGKGRQGKGSSSSSKSSSGDCPCGNSGVRRLTLSYNHTKVVEKGLETLVAPDIPWKNCYIYAYDSKSDGIDDYFYPKPTQYEGQGESEINFRRVDPDDGSNVEVDIDWFPHKITNTEVYLVCNGKLSGDGVPMAKWNFHTSCSDDELLGSHGERHGDSSSKSSSSDYVDPTAPPVITSDKLFPLTVTLWAGGMDGYDKDGYVPPNDAAVCTETTNHPTMSPAPSTSMEPTNKSCERPLRDCEQLCDDPFPIDYIPSISRPSGDGHSKSKSGKGKGGKGGKGGSWSWWGSGKGKGGKGKGGSKYKCECDKDKGVRRITFELHEGRMQDCTFYLRSGKNADERIPMGNCTSTEDNKYCEPDGYYYKADIRPGNYRTVLFAQKYNDVLLLIEGKEEFENGDEDKPTQFWKYHTSCSDEELAGSVGKFVGDNAFLEYYFFVKDWSDSEIVTCNSASVTKHHQWFDHETCIELEEAYFQGRSMCDMSQTTAADLKKNPRFLRHLVKYKDFTKEGPSIELWNGWNLAASNETCAADEDDKWAISYEYFQTHVGSKRETGKDYGADVGTADKVMCTFDNILQKDVATIWMWVNAGDFISESPYLDFDDSNGYCALKFTIICGDHGYEPNLATDVRMAPSTQTDFTCREMLALGDHADWNDFKQFGYKNLLKEEGDFKCEVKEGKKYIKKISFKQYFSSSGKVRSKGYRRQMRTLEGSTEVLKTAVATAVPKASAAESNGIMDMSADSSHDATQERKLWGTWWGTYSYWHDGGDGHTYDGWWHDSSSDDFEAVEDVPGHLTRKWFEDNGEKFQHYKWIVDGPVSNTYENSGCRLGDGTRGNEGSDYDKESKSEDDCRRDCLGDDQCTGWESSSDGHCEIWRSVINVHHTDMSSVSGLSCHIKVDEFNTYENSGCRLGDGTKGIEDSDYDKESKSEDECRLDCLGDDQCTGWESSSNGHCEIWHSDINAHHTDMSSVSGLSCHIKKVDWNVSCERKFSINYRWEMGDQDISSSYRCESEKDGKKCMEKYDTIDKMHCESDGFARIKIWAYHGSEKIKDLWDPDRKCDDNSFGENVSEWYKDLCQVIVKVKCRDSCLGDTRRLDQTYLASLPEPPDVNEEEAASFCKYDLPVEDVRPIVVDQCSAQASRSPVSVFSKDGNTVTFTLSQVWKECNAAERYALDWIAADYVTTSGNLECHRMDSIGCGDFSMLTAKCTDGVAVIDLYASDSSEDSPFRQADGSSLIVPEACYPEGEDSDACHFRYVIDCAPRCEDVMPKPKSALSSIKEAFTSGLFGRK